MNDGYDVVITVQGLQIYTDGDPDASELMTQGRLTLWEDGFILTYEETELTGMEGTTTCFIQEGEQITLTRTGTVNNHMVFREGRQHSSLYETPHGSVTVDIRTNYLRSTIGEAGGALELSYDVSIQKKLMCRNHVHVRVRRSNSR